MPHALTYDTLPCHSTLRREIVGQTLKVLSPAGEPGPLARRAAARRTALSAALITLLDLLVGLLLIGPLLQERWRRMNNWLAAAVLMLLAVVGLALFLLVWKALFTRRIGAVEAAFQESTALAVEPGRLLVETTGPSGDHSALAWAYPAIRRSRWKHGPVICLELTLPDGRAIQILPGRDDSELRWIEGAIRQFM
ncbi:MAG: hypothetical protein ACREJC_21155 [Tepidisphaeraceae bacterium]